MRSVIELGCQWLAWIAHEFTLFAAVGMLACGLDDLAVDLIWMARSLLPRCRRRTLAELPPPRVSGPIAVFVPAWAESAVIGGMLRAALQRLRHDDYRIYVGTYPNDPATAHAARVLGDPRVRLVGGTRQGPTSKAECLNRIWRAMLADEAASGRRFKAVVLHDAEDIVHPDELALYDRAVERFDLVQIPVHPLPAHGTSRGARLIAAIYCDEFAAAHGRDMPVREAIGAALPSAGVGCAIGRDILARVAAENGGLPFDDESLTEDYELGLRIAALGGRGTFAIVPPRPGAPPIAVRAHFPETVAQAVRQKARWITGIALAGWDRLRWRGGMAERWMRFRDRRAVLAAAVLVAGYLAFAAGSLCALLGMDFVGTPALRWLLFANLALLAERLAIRAMAVNRIYGRAAALLSIPRALPANLLAIAAAARALWLYVPGRRPVWDKTAHVFPATLPCD